MSEPTLQDVKTILEQSNTEIQTKYDALERRMLETRQIVDRMIAMGPPVSHPRATDGVELPSLKAWQLASMGGHEARGLRIAQDDEGGYLVLDQAGPFHDRMRPNNVVLAAEPVIVDMTSASMGLPGLSGSTTVYAPGEAGTLPTGQPALQQVRLTAKKYTCRTIVSSELLADSTPSARRIIADDHARQLANRLDLDMLEGNSTAIRGLRWQAGVNMVELGAGGGGGNGATPTLDDIADLLLRLEAANADLTRVRLIMAPRTWNTFRKLQDQYDRYQLQPDPTAEARRQLFGVPVLVSPQITTTETVGSSHDCSYILAADFSRVVVGRRLEVAVLYDPYSQSGTDQVVVQSQVRYDLALLHAAACDVLTGVKP